MQHRHLTVEAGWSKAAIDSVLERGDLADGQELFAATAQDSSLAATVIEVASLKNSRPEKSPPVCTLGAIRAKKCASRPSKRCREATEDHLRSCRLPQADFRLQKSGL